MISSISQDKIFRRKRLSTGANFVHVYLEIWDKGILKFNKNSLMYAFIKLYETTWLKWK